MENKIRVRKSTGTRHPDERPAWAARTVCEHEPGYGPQAAMPRSIAPKMGISCVARRKWADEMESDLDQRPGAAAAGTKRLKEWERENRDRLTASEIPRKASTCFTRAKFASPIDAMNLFIGAHRDGLVLATLTVLRQPVEFTHNAGR
ncbi:hypothetical protein [Burkholderia glumae]|uniref:hypothetical protein n=1 Tax=Burkholderia glumae TaxID=337 RepID=UPI002150CB5F|nr:hypothetical protein [Burkholderia glumae]